MGFRFVASSLFPHIKYDDILEIEFAISNALGIPFEYNHKEFFELIWFYERLAKQIKQDNQREMEQEGEMSLGNLGPNVLQQMTGDSNG